MPILYSAVGFNKVISNSYASCDGNFNDVSEALISKIFKDSKMTYSHGRYLIHYILQNKYFYICITDNTCQRSRAFLFLNEIRRKYCLGAKDFTRVLATEMFRYNEDYSTVVVQNGDLDELNTIGVAPSDNILAENILYVRNDDSLRYMTISSATPKKVILTLSEINLKIIAALIIVLLLICIFKCSLLISIVFLIILYYIFKLDLL